MKTKQPGFILLIIFLLLSIATIVVAQIYQQGVLYNSFIPVVSKREQAKQIALSGIQVAISQLALHDQKLTPLDEQQDEKVEKKAKNSVARAKDLLKVLLVVQNRWQTFQLEEAQDGIDATLKICITCEDGKIPLGALIDFQKKKNVNKTSAKGEDFLKTILGNVVHLTENRDLSSSLTEFIQQAQFEPSDITDLLNFKDFRVFYEKVYFEPEENKSSEQSDQLKQKIYFADLFTLWSKEPVINPLLFSPSVRTVFWFNPQTVGKPTPSDQIKTILEKIDPQLSSWQADWDAFLSPLYGKDYKTLPKDLITLLSSKFEPRVFSVLCYGKVGRVGQKLLAIVAREFNEKGELFKVKKIYWL